jgi:hypothetical protein
MAKIKTQQFPCILSNRKSNIYPSFMLQGHDLENKLLMNVNLRHAVASVANSCDISGL